MLYLLQTRMREEELSMKILIDGDSCCVLQTTERIAKKYGLDCHIYCNARRVLETKYATLHMTDITRDAADFALIGACSPGDLVVTSDGGLAAMALSRQAYVLNPYGGEYNEQNIMLVLSNRHAVMHTRNKKGKQIKRTCPLDRTETYRDGLLRIVHQYLRTVKKEK